MNWLLLRGLAREQRHWGRFTEILANEIPGSTVHRIDLPGAGTECHRDSPLTVPAIANDVRRRWFALRDAHPGPWSLLGISLGGMVSLAWCGMYANDFERLVVVNSSIGGLSPPWHRMRPGVYAGVLRSLGDQSPEGRERRVLAMTTRICPDVDARAKEWATYSAERPMRRANVGRQILAAMRFRAPARLDTPMLVLSGGRDGLTHPNCPRAIAERYGAPIEVHPDAGHDLSSDAPEWMAARVREWIGTPE